MKKRAFTLVEVVLATFVFSSLFAIVFGMYSHFIKIKSSLDARFLVVTATYDLVERLNLILQNYTIDYEEYFNRTMMWCGNTNERSDTFTWSGAMGWSWYCTVFTAYGNGSVRSVSWDIRHDLYGCSSTQGQTLNENDWGRIVGKLNAVGSWCYESVSTIAFRQWYGQYAQQFIDVKSDVDDKPGSFGDDDDEHLGKWPIAIQDTANIQELYLISKDKKTRIIIRRSLVATEDINGDWLFTLPQEKHYTLQMLQLRAFDAWSLHNFDDPNSIWIYDWTIDTRACDASAWYNCNGQALANVWNMYAEYKLPRDADDWWVTLLTNDMTVSAWSLGITPPKDPQLAWWETAYQSNPYVKLYVWTNIYGNAWAQKIGYDNLQQIEFDIQTSFNIKTHY